MLVRDLVPGMLVEPITGSRWILVPWRGVDNEVVKKYLSVSSAPSTVHHSWFEDIGTDPLLYIGPLDRTDDGDVHTPGRQLVLYGATPLSVDPSSWRFLRPAEKS